MVKKVYTETVKKWALGLGLSGGTLIGFYFLYLSMLGSITIMGYSNDTICAGTLDDPCYAYINFTANEDIFIYPVGYDPWGRNSTFAFDPAVESWTLQRSWGTGWRTIPLNQSCTGTWCGLSDSKDTREFSVAFRKGNTYQIRIVAYKKRADDVIKWSAINGAVDPTWEAAAITNETSQAKIDQVFPTLKESSGENKDAIFKMSNTYIQDEDISNFELDYKAVCGGIQSYQIYLLSNQTKEVQTTYWKQIEVCSVDNSSKKTCHNESVVDKVEVKNVTTQDYYNTKIVKKGNNEYKIVIEPTISKCATGWGFEIDWIPEVILNTTRYTQTKWAWMNISFGNRTYINCSNIDTDTPFMVNGSSGLLLTGDTTRQYIWTRCQPSLYLYWTSYNTYAIGNETNLLAFEVERGNNTGYNPSDVWDNNYAAVYHMTNLSASKGTGGNLAISGTVAATNTNCFFAGCYVYDGTTDYTKPAANLTFPINSTFTIESFGRSDDALVAYDCAFGSKAGGGYKRYFATPNTDTPPAYTWGGIISNKGSGAWFHSSVLSSTSMLYHVFEMNRSGGYYWLNTTNIYSNSTLANGFEDGANPEFWIGSCEDPSWEWDGTLDEVRISNISRSTKYISDVYSNYQSLAGYGLLGTTEQTSLNFSIQSPLNTTYIGSNSIWNISINYTISTVGLTVDSCWYNYTHDGVGDNICEQEFANQSYSCGAVRNTNGTTYAVSGTWIGGGTTNAYLTYDGDWSTYSYVGSSSSNATLIVNYTRPPDAIQTGTVWRVKDANGEASLTLNNDCWASTIQVRARDIGGVFTKIWDCKNWSNGQWIALRTQTTGSHGFYEEAMWWKIPNLKIVNCTNTSRPIDDYGAYTDTIWVNSTTGILVSHSVSYFVNSSLALNITSPKNITYQPSSFPYLLDFNYTITTTGDKDSCRYNSTTNTTFYIYNYCHQENAMYAVGGVDGSCTLNFTGGNYTITGTWSVTNTPERIFDDDYNTAGCALASFTGYVYANYTKPVDGAINNGSALVIGTSNGLEDAVNITIPQNCYDYFSNKISFRYWLKNDGSATTYIYCYSGSWDLIYSYGSICLYEDAINWASNTSEDTRCDIAKSIYPNNGYTIIQRPGNYIDNFFANLTDGNSITSSVSYTVNKTGVLTVQSPTNTTYSGNRLPYNVSLNFTVYSNIGIDSCWTENVTLPNCQNASITIDRELQNRKTQVYANLTDGTIINTNVSFYVNITDEIDECMNLTLHNRNYYMSGDIFLPSVETVCIRITGENNTVNCNNNDLVGNLTVGTYAFYITALGNNIVNCRMDNFSLGIFVNKRITLINNTVVRTINTTTSSNGIGFWIDTASSSDSIVLNSRIKAARYGIVSDGDRTVFNNTYIEGDDFNWLSEEGIIITPGDNVSIYNISVINAYGPGILISTSSEDVKVNCLGGAIIGRNISGMYGVGSSQPRTTMRNCYADAWAYPFYFSSDAADYGIIDNCIANTTRSYTYINGADYINITNSIFIGSAAQPSLYLANQANNAYIYNTTGITNGAGQGLRCTYCNDLIIVDSTGISTSPTGTHYGIYLTYTNRTILRNVIGNSTYRAIHIDISDGLNANEIKAYSTGASIGLYTANTKNCVMSNITTITHYSGLSIATVDNCTYKDIDINSWNWDEVTYYPIYINLMENSTIENVDIDGFRYSPIMATRTNRDELPCSNELINITEDGKIFSYYNNEIGRKDENLNQASLYYCNVSNSIIQNFTTSRLMWVTYSSNVTASNLILNSTAYAFYMVMSDNISVSNFDVDSYYKGISPSTNVYDWSITDGTIDTEKDTGIQQNINISRGRVENVVINAGYGRSLWFQNTVTDGRYNNITMHTTNASFPDCLIFAYGSENNIISNCSIQGSGNNSVVIMGATTLNVTNNTFIQNKIFNGTTCIAMNTNTTGNYFIANNISNCDYYINDTALGVNYYNGSEGNAYENVISGAVYVGGITNSTYLAPYFIGIVGAVPYSESNSLGKIIGPAIDYAPLTLNGDPCIYPGAGDWYINTLYDCILDINTNVTGNIIFTQFSDRTTTNRTDLSVEYLFITDSTDSVSGNPATVTNAIWTSSGKYNGAYLFNGINTSITVPNATVNLASGTLSLWAKTDTLDTSAQYAASGYMYSHYQASSRLTIRQSSLAVIFGIGTTAALPDPGFTMDLNWHYYALSYNGTHYFMYIDGELKNSSTYSGMTTQVVSYMGRDAASARAWFNGTIDEVKIWSRSLSGTEIYEDYAGSARCKAKINTTNIFWNNSVGTLYVDSDCDIRLK